MADPDPEAQSHALMFRLFPDLFVQKPFRYMGRQIMPMGMTDQMQQQIDRRGPARTGDDLTIDFKQLFGNIQMQRLLSSRPA